ncbi:hypothetical protein R80B4_01569 [Fibrobacteres bacterium R8-0-B4]
MITRIIVALTLSIMSATFLFVDCSKNNSGNGQLSAQELALLSEIESATAQPTPEEAQTPQPQDSAVPQLAQASPSSSTQGSTPTGQSDAKKKSAQTGNNVVEIREKMFIAQTNDIYINKDDYLGKTIKYEGVFDQSEWRGNGKTYRYVIRFGPGCCPGDAAAAGFEVLWDGDNSGKHYPKKNDWVEVTGVLHEYDDDGIPSLRLALTSLTVLAKRGKEKVTQ